MGGKPETTTDPILVSIESLVECGPARTREKKGPPQRVENLRPHQPYLSQHRESSQMRTRKDERKKDRARRGKRLGNSLNSITQRLSPFQCERIEKKRRKRVRGR